MPHDFSAEIQAAFAAYVSRRQKVAALPPPRFHHGPYFPPSVAIWQEVECARFGAVWVRRWSAGPLPWPQTYISGRASMILFGDLARAVEVESEIAVALAWGVCSETVVQWRKALGVESLNEGTRARLTILAPVAISPEQGRRGRALASQIATRERAVATRRARGTDGKREWTPDQIAWMGVLPDSVIAERVGCHTRTVTIERNRRGIVSIQCGGTTDNRHPLEGARIKARRHALDLTQQQVAARYGCNRSRIAALEADLSTSVTADTLEAIARALECQPADLQEPQKPQEPQEL